MLCVYPNREHTRYVNIGVYVMFLYLEITLQAFRVFKYLNVLLGLGELSAFVQRRLFCEKMYIILISL